jgi:hypothetical protein
MVIVPLEYVELVKILKEFKFKDEYGHEDTIMNLFGESYVTDAVNRCKKLLEEVRVNQGSKNEIGRLYILCPLSYYNFWLEVKSGKNLSKYYPQSLENIFTTIEIMTPTQRNLYNMCQVNDENNKQLKASLDENIKVVNEKLARIESRVSRVESQVEEIIRKAKEEEQKRQEEFNARVAGLVRHEMNLIRLEEQALTYEDLDPLIFFMSGDGVDFFDKGNENKKAHLVTCFGKEFPVEFFSMNGVTVYTDSENVRNGLRGKK